MNTPGIIYKTALAVFKDKKVLLTREAKHKDTFYMLGGRVEEGESEIGSLEREVREEIGCAIVQGSARFLEMFEAPAHGFKNMLVNIRLYEGALEGEPMPMSEIEEIRYFDSTIHERHLTPASEVIMRWLKMNGYIT